MSNILKAAKLDFALIKPYLKTFIFTWLFPVFFAAINRSLLTGISFAMCCTAMTSGYTFSIIEKNNMERMFGILPVSKKDFVLGRYLYVILTGLISLIFALIMQPLVLRLLGEKIEFSDIIIAAFTGIFLFSLYTVFQIPGFYKFGAIKGRLFTAIPVIVFLFTLLFLFQTPVNESPLFISVMNYSPLVLTTLILLLIIILYIFSVLTSIKILQKKEI